MPEREASRDPAADRRISESVTAFAIIAIDRGGVVTEWNAGAEQIFGWPRSEVIGKAAASVVACGDGTVGWLDRQLTQARDAGCRPIEGWLLRKNGTRVHAFGEIASLHGADADHSGYVIALQAQSKPEVGQRAARDDAEQLEAIFKQSPSFMALLRGPDHRFERVNPGYVKLVGGRDVVGRTVADALPDAADQGFVKLLDDVYRSGQAHHASEMPITLQAGPEVAAEDLYLDFVYQPIRDAGGSVVGIFVEGVDVTQRVLSARRLREAEDRYRALAENVDVGMCVVELKFDADRRAIDYRIIDGNPAYERHTGLYGSVGKWVSEFAPGLERHWFDLYGNVALTGQSARFEEGAVALDNRWFEVEAHRVGDPERHQVAILFTDITQRKQAEDRRTLLNHELAHRLKNTLAVVQSVATQTLRNATDLHSARDSLTKRIQALSRAHDILLTGQQDAGAVEAIIRGAVALHDPDGRIAMRGPELYIGPKAALALALVMHELSTNAAKYGALSAPEGRVEVEWVVEVDDETRLPTLDLNWRELGGPPAGPPTRRGFGTRLIEMGLSGSAASSVEIDYAPEGLRCRIVASLIELQSSEDE